MDHTQLLHDLTEALPETELRHLCARLGVGYRRLAGRDYRQKAAVLVALLVAEQRLPDLLAELVRRRPYLAARYETGSQPNWLDQLGERLERATPAQITAALAQLSQPASAAKATRHQDEEDSSGRPTVQEGPTARWDSEQHPRPGRSRRVRFQPYSLQGPVTDPQRFSGRLAQRRQLRRLIQGMNSALVVGLPASGRSSLLYLLAHGELFEPAWRLLFAFTDGADPHRSQPELLNEALGAWNRSAGHARWPTVNSAADFARQVRFLARSGYRPVWCLDDVDKLLQRDGVLDEALLAVWAGLLQSNRLALVMSATQPVADPVTGSGRLSRLAPLLETVYLGLMGGDEATALLRRPLPGGGEMLSVETIADLVLLCGAHPYLLQLGAAELFSAGEADLSPAVQRAFVNAAQPTWARMVAALTPQQQALLWQPLHASPPLVVARQYRRLLEMGMLVAERDGYRYFSSAFADWLPIRRSTSAPG